MQHGLRQVLDLFFAHRLRILKAFASYAFDAEFGGEDLSYNQIRDPSDFIGSTTAAAPGPYIPCGACFLAGGALTRSSTASPMCSDLRDRCGAAAAAYAVGRIHPQR